jgi:cytochrome c oxidase assembly protein subunit 11
MTRAHHTPVAGGRRNARTALVLVGVFAGMVGLSFAAVPLYQLFCQVTGYGGTTQVASAAPEAAAETMTVRFNADISPDLAWRFQPREVSTEVRVGARAIAFYEAENLADRPLSGTATFNVTPLKAGKYFSKIACFCFTEQTLQPGERVEMPVEYFVDPAILEDPAMADVQTITLSYTFFPQPDAEADLTGAGTRHAGRTGAGMDGQRN